MPEIWSVKKRKEIKARAKEIVWANIGRVMGIYILFLIPMCLLLLLVVAMAGGSVFFSDAGMGLNPSIASMELFMQRFANAVLVALLLLIFVGGPLRYGLETFFIALWQDKSPGVTTLFAPFSSLQSYWASVRMMVCLLIRSLFWLLPAYLISVAIESIAIVAGWESVDPLPTQIATGQWSSVCVELTVLGIGLLLNLAATIKMRTFETGYWLLDDQKDSSATLVTDISSSLFHGHFKDAFWFVLSFAGWFILQGALTTLCTVISFSGSTLATVLSWIAMLCLSLALMPFILAYSYVSFYGMFETLLTHDPVLKIRFHSATDTEMAEASPAETSDSETSEASENANPATQSYYAADMRPKPEFPDSPESTAAVESTEPIEPIQPTQPTEPPPSVNPVEPTASMESSTPTDAVESAASEEAETANPPSDEN